MDHQTVLPEDMIKKIRAAVQMEYESEGLLTKRGQNNNAACDRLEIEAERLMDNVIKFVWIIRLIRTLYGVSSRR